LSDTMRQLPCLSLSLCILPTRLLTSSPAVSACFRIGLSKSGECAAGSDATWWLVLQSPVNLVLDDLEETSFPASVFTCVRRSLVAPHPCFRFSASPSRLLSRRSLAVLEQRNNNETDCCHVERRDRTRAGSDLLALLVGEKKERLAAQEPRGTHTKWGSRVSCLQLGGAVLFFNHRVTRDRGDRGLHAIPYSESPAAAPPIMGSGCLLTGRRPLQVASTINPLRWSSAALCACSRWEIPLLVGPHDDHRPLGGWFATESSSHRHPPTRHLEARSLRAA
jgi:hypothetical protein